MKELLKDLAKIIFGNILLATGYGCITIPNKIVNGGVTSFSLILSNIIPIDVSILVNVFTLMLLAVSYWKLGRDNFFKTMFSCVCYLGFLNLILARGIQFIMHPVLVVVIASVVVGLGYYFCVSGNASTAGFDTVAMIINKKNPKIEIGTTMRYIGIFVLLLGCASLGWKAVVYGILFSILESQTINIMLRLEKQAKEMGVKTVISVPEVF